MKHAEMQAFARELAPVVRDHVARESEALRKEVADLLSEVAGLRRELAGRPTPEKGDAGPPGPAGPPGKDADVEEIAARLLPEIERAVAALPPAEPGEKGEKGDKGDPGDRGEDGLGISETLIDRSGSLVVIMQDGTKRELGPVVGKDGEPGAPGKDGADGLGFDDLTVTHDGHREFTLVFERGDRRKEFSFSLPVTLDCGVYSEGRAYEPGDSVTWGGSLWIAQRDTCAKPGESDDWRLAVKRGRDGRIPDMDAFLERALPQLTERLAPVVRKAIKEAAGDR